MKNSIFRAGNYKRMAIILASIFMFLNISIILFNNNYLENIIKKKETEFVQILTHMIQYEDEESTSLFIEHYSHVNNVEVILYEGDNIIYQTSESINVNSSYDIIVDDEVIGRVVVDFSNPIDRAMNNDFILFVNAIIVLTYVVIIVLSINTTKKSNNLLKIEIENIENSLNKKKYKVVHKEFKEISKKIEELHIMCESSNFDKLMYSHEIKTALMIILSNVESLRNKDTKITEELIEEIKSEVFTINNYIEGINNNIDPEINASSILEDHVKKRRTVMKTKNIILSSKINKDIMLNIPENDFSVIVSNLLSNAFFYSNKNGKVSVSLEQNQSFINLIVEDDGIGFSGSDINVIYQENYRSKEAKTSYKKGSGLGLYIVKALLEKNNCEIEAIKKDVGLKFIVKFNK